MGLNAFFLLLKTVDYQLERVLLGFSGFLVAVGGFNLFERAKQDFDGVLLDFTGFLPGLSGF